MKFINFVRYGDLNAWRSYEIFEWLIEGLNPDLLVVDPSSHQESGHVRSR